MSQGNAPRQRLPRAVRRERLLEGALAAFLAGGYHGTHVADIIERAGIARGTFYLYFDSKRDVFAALVERMLAIFLEARPPEPEPPLVDRASAEAMLRNSYRTVLRTFRENRGLCRLLFEEAVGVEQGFAERLDAHYDVWRDRVRDTLRLLVEAGVARADLDVEVVAVMVVGMVERLTRRYVLADEPPDMERLVDTLVVFELDGVTGAP
jgi:AcrR family transcriptional regulator